MEDVENKKWMITRLDNVIRAHEKFLEGDIEKFDNFIKDKTGELEKLRNKILASIGFLISLVIGLASLNIKPYPVESTISALLFIGLSTYLIFSLFESKNNQILGRVYMAIKNSRDELDFVSGYFITSSLHIDTFKSSDYDKFHYYFVFFIFPSLYLERLQITYGLRNSAYLSIPTKNHLRDLYLGWKELMDEAVKRYEESGKEYQSVEFLEEFSKYEKRLQDYKMTLSSKS